MTWRPGEHITTPREAEECAVWHLRELGFDDAQLTPVSADGGVDVRSSRILAEVKQLTAVVGRPLLQRLVGARGAQHHLALAFYSANGYSPPAAAYAEEMAIALFTYSVRGEVAAANGHARELECAAPWRAAPRRARTTRTARATPGTAASARATFAEARARAAEQTPAEAWGEVVEAWGRFAGWLVKALLVVGIVGLVFAVGISCQALVPSGPDAELHEALGPLAVGVGALVVRALLRRWLRHL